MKLVTGTVLKDMNCNECKSKENLKALIITSNKIVLCDKCREKLHGMLYNDYLEEVQYEE